MASGIENQIYDLLKIPTVDYVQHFWYVILEPGWQPGGKLPAGCQPGTKITLKKLPTTILEP